MMSKVSIPLTTEGVKTGYLEADSMFVYENSGRTELKKLHVTFYTPTGVKTSDLTANEGSYRMRTGEMEARGNVVGVNADGATLHTSLLRYDQSKNQISTDKPYVYDFGDRHIEGGAGFTSDPSFSNLSTQGLKGTAGHFTLPGQ